MGSITVTPVTPGTGADVAVFNTAASDLEQIVRQAWASTKGTTVDWACLTAGAASVMTFDDNRVGIMMMNKSSGRVYINWDTSVPGVAADAHDWYLESGDRFLVPDYARSLAISLRAEFQNGWLIIVPFLRS